LEGDRKEGLVKMEVSDGRDLSLNLVGDEAMYENVSERFGDPP